MANTISERLLLLSMRILCVLLLVVGHNGRPQQSSFVFSHTVHGLAIEHDEESSP